MYEVKNYYVLTQKGDNPFTPAPCDLGFNIYDKDTKSAKFSYKGDGALCVKTKEDIKRVYDLLDKFDSFEVRYLPKEAVYVYENPQDLRAKYIWKFNDVDLVEFLEYLRENNVECFALICEVDYEE